MAKKRTNKLPKELSDLKVSLSVIDSLYTDVMGWGKNNKKTKQGAENAFTAELYHHYKTLMKSNKTNKTFYRSLVLHFDLAKHRFGSIRPDLVLHRSPYDHNDQRLFIEVKTTSATKTKEIECDINKLLNATRKFNKRKKQLGFRLGVYIVGNIPKEKINGIIKRMCNQPMPELDCIWLVYFDAKQQNPDYSFKKFSQVIKD